MQNSAKRPKVSTNEESLTTPTICVLGATGVGKGSTLNSCFRSHKFSTSSMFASDTIKPASFVLPWRGTGEPMRGVDLCGFSDSEGRDTGFIEAMVSYLKQEVRYVNVFLLLLNSQEARVGMHLKDMLVALKAVFGNTFTKNVMVGFTRWDYTKKGAILRRGVTKEALSTNVNGLLRELLGHAHDCECVFLDNTVSMFQEEELRELHGAELPFITESFDGMLQAIRRAALGNAPFQCADIEGTLAERDVGRDMIEREHAAVAQGNEAFEAFSRRWGASEVIEEPKCLEAKLKEDARLARESLRLFLAAKTKPDLEHVMASVLRSFEAKVKTATESVLFKNRGAAGTFNRTLRMRLEREYAAFHGSLQAGGSSEAPREQFVAVYAKFSDLVVEFITGCKGGALAWQSFLKLQENLRLEQAYAREKILRADLVAGNELPEISGALDAKAVATHFGVKSLPAPEWLVGLEKLEKPPSS